MSITSKQRHSLSKRNIGILINRRGLTVPAISKKLAISELWIEKWLAGGVGFPHTKKAILFLIYLGYDNPSDVYKVSSWKDALRRTETDLSIIQQKTETFVANDVQPRELASMLRELKRAVAYQSDLFQERKYPKWNLRREIRKVKEAVDNLAGYEPPETRQLIDTFYRLLDSLVFAVVNDQSVDCLQECKEFLSDYEDKTGRTSPAATKTLAKETQLVCT